LNCHQEFVLDARNAKRQKYCTAAPCKAASKHASHTKWQSKPENQGYHRGQEAVNRVRLWREAHPGYSQHTYKGLVIDLLLQDFLPTPDLAPMPSFIPTPEVDLSALHDDMSSQHIESEGISSQAPAVELASLQKSLHLNTGSSIQISCNAPAQILPALQDSLILISRGERTDPGLANYYISCRANKWKRWRY
jgi:hypothetical protein